ncbi:unnamed protein product [Lupinus luteus]|uniref:MADS-box domain-containing protein n=1 Tax=Lupinus luteus TaxID=3873 RepID=A0AAV1WND7_LUPLU
MGLGKPEMVASTCHVSRMVILALLKGYVKRRIANDASRKSTFKQRRDVLSNKMQELSNLCNVEEDSIRSSSPKVKPCVARSDLFTRIIPTDVTTLNIHDAASR